MIRVLLVDDHALFRRGVRSLLEDFGMQVVGEAADGDEALRLVETLSPDVVLMDLHMPNCNGAAATRRIAGRARVLILTVSDQDEDLFPAIEAGANGYILKDLQPEDLVRAIMTVASGGSVLASQVTGAVIAAAARTPFHHDLSRLSAREREVLRLIAKGLSNGEIAAVLAISTHSVKTYVERLYEKLQVDSRSEAAAIAGAEGLG